MSKNDPSATPEELRKVLVAKILEVLQSGSDEECAICLDSLKTPVITHCAHVFCRACIQQVIQAEERPGVSGWGEGRWVGEGVG